MVTGNQKIIFSKIDHLGTVLQKIRETFLCNIEINNDLTHMNHVNMMSLNLHITDVDILVINLQPLVRILTFCCTVHNLI